MAPLGLDSGSFGSLWWYIMESLLGEVLVATIFKLQEPG